MEIKNLKVSEANWKWLMITKFDLGYDTADDLLSKMKECFIDKYQIKSKRESLDLSLPNNKQKNPLHNKIQKEVIK